jgi:hypothetical protein
MEEGTTSTKAIPLRRSRAAARGPVEASGGLTTRFGSGLWTTVAPARSLWLASLGGTSFAVRGAAAVWLALVEEGAAVERRLRRLVSGTPQI